MEINNSSKGQVFTITATLLISLIILLFITTTDISQEQDSSTFKNWFDNSFQNIPFVFNGAIKEHNSIENARNDLYSYNQFIERRSRSKGIVFSSSYLLVFPKDGKATYINYQDSSIEINLKTDSSWTNSTIDSMQNLKVSYTSGQTDFRLIVPSHNVDEAFTASNPRVFGRMRMSSNNQIWINSALN